MNQAVGWNQAAQLRSQDVRDSPDGAAALAPGLRTEDGPGVRHPETSRPASEILQKHRFPALLNDQHHPHSLTRPVPQPRGGVGGARAHRSRV